MKNLSGNSKKSSNTINSEAKETKLPYDDPNNFGQALAMRHLQIMKEELKREESTKQESVQA